MVTSSSHVTFKINNKGIRKKWVDLLANEWEITALTISNDSSFFEMHCTIRQQRKVALDILWMRSDSSSYCHGQQLYQAVHPSQKKSRNGCFILEQLSCKDKASCKRGNTYFCHLESRLVDLFPFSTYTNGIQTFGTRKHSPTHSKSAANTVKTTTTSTTENMHLKYCPTISTCLQSRTDASQTLGMIPTKFTCTFLATQYSVILFYSWEQNSTTCSVPKTNNIVLP